MVIKEATNEDTMANAGTTTAGASEPSDKTVIIEQEIKFARALAGNDPKLRRKVLKNLKTWLTTRSQSTFAFSDTDFLRLWKGLFYCMWMSDKPLIQEELAESVGSLARCFDENVPVALQFFKAFMVTMGNEWFGIDRWRMDKFMMFVRRVTRQVLFVLHGNKWQTEHVALLVQTIEATVLNNSVCSYGLQNHFNDLLLEEIAKVSDGEVPKEVITQLVEPYVRYLLKNDDITANKSIVHNIFHALMQQSDLGQMYEEKFDLWKRSNFVTGDIDNVHFNVEYQYEDEEEEDGEDDQEQGQEDDQAGENDGEEQPENGDADQEKEDEADEANGDAEEGDDSEEEEGTEKVYDPRAGRVSVEIPQIEFDPLEIVSLIEKHRYKPYATARGKKSAMQLVRQLNRFANGAYPLGIKRVPSISPKHYEVDIDKKVKEMEDFKQELYGEKTRKSWKEIKKEKQRKRKLLREAKEAQTKRVAVATANGDRSTYGEEDDVTDGSTQAEANITTAQNGSDELDQIEKKAPSSKKRPKLRKKNLASVKKERKLELLRKKKEEKLLLLKERMKQSKGTKTSKEAVVSAKSQQQESTPAAQASNSSPAEVTQPKAVTKKDASPKKKQTKDKSAVTKKPFDMADEWSEPPKDGEQEYFIVSRKFKTKLASPTTAPKEATTAKPSPKRMSASPSAASADAEPITPARKRVKIALNKNVAQDLVEHIKQVKSSPQLPFDSSRKPSKSLLKPNLIPSPINPFYKKKIGLK